MHCGAEDPGPLEDPPEGDLTQRFCFVCSTSLPLTARACAQCGSDQPDPCALCGAPTLAGDRGCGLCGIDLDVAVLARAEGLFEETPAGAGT
jgi:predicted amidophosphoribosyltransferase